MKSDSGKNYPDLVLSWFQTQQEIKKPMRRGKRLLNKQVKFFGFRQATDVAH